MKKLLSVLFALCMAMCAACSSGGAAGERGQTPALPSVREYFADKQ